VWSREVRFISLLSFAYCSSLGEVKLKARVASLMPFLYE
jgi:hypothetical protein